jgi:hypothetical protein
MSCKSPLGPSPLRPPREAELGAGAQQAPPLPGLKRHIAALTLPCAPSSRSLQPLPGLKTPSCPCGLAMRLPRGAATPRRSPRRPLADLAALSCLCAPRRRPRCALHVRRVAATPPPVSRPEVGKPTTTFLGASSPTPFPPPGC